MGRRHVADVGEVEGQERPEVRRLELVTEPGESFAAEAVEGDAALPVDGIGAEGRGAVGLIGSASLSMRRLKCLVVGMSL